MSEWELFIRGLSKTFEEFFNKMVEKGKTDLQSGAGVTTEEEKRVGVPVTDNVVQPEPPEKKKDVVKKDLVDLESRILKAIGQFTHGCTMKEIAKVLDIQWHFLRIPLRNLIAQQKVLKDGKIYRLPKRDVSSEAKEPQLFDVQPKRRRIVDARIWEMKKEEEKEKTQQLNLTPREREILKFKILTAFRGRPEGLTLDELAAVLGRTKDGLDIIINELVDDEKVTQGQNNKYFLV